VEDGCGIAKMFDQHFRVYGTDTIDAGKGELKEGWIFHGEVELVGTIYGKGKLGGGGK
jgi:hypothetical protein